MIYLGKPMFKPLLCLKNKKQTNKQTNKPYSSINIILINGSIIIKYSNLYPKQCVTMGFLHVCRKLGFKSFMIWLNLPKKKKVSELLTCP